MSIMNRHSRIIRFVFPGLLLIACDSPPIEPVTPPPVGIRILDGDGQVGTANQRLRHYRVEAIDKHSRAVSGVPITWSVASGGGSISPTHGVTAAKMDSTGARDVYAATVHTLGSFEGAYTVTATAPDIPGAPQATFTAHVASAVIDIQVANYWACFYYDICTATFDPADVTVIAGQSVGWSWGGEPCDVIFEDDPAAPTSAPVRHTGGHLRTFTVPGTFRYRCTLFSSSFTDGMVGVVTVQ